MRKKVETLCDRELEWIFVSGTGLLLQSLRCLRRWPHHASLLASRVTMCVMEEDVRSMRLLEEDHRYVWKQMIHITVTNSCFGCDQKLITKVLSQTCVVAAAQDVGAFYTWLTLVIYRRIAAPAGFQLLYQPCDPVQRSISFLRELFC